MTRDKSPVFVFLALYLASPAALLFSSACSDDDTHTEIDAGNDMDAGMDAETIDAAQPDAAEEIDAAQSECVPETASFYVYDLSVMPPQYIEVPATCRRAGSHGLIFVADDIWDNPVTQSEVDVLSTAFDETTPADATRGIFAVTTGTFGETTDVDDNDRIFLLLLELPSYQGHEFDGYIRREDMIGGSHSNNAELLYLDAVRNDISSEYMLGVVSHEFFHMIHLNHDPAEESWLDETLAESSMVICGYLGDLAAWVPDFANNPNVQLTDNSPTFHYGAGMLFGTYLWERFGADTLTALVENTSTGVASLEDTLADMGYVGNFRALLSDWAAANFLDDTTVGDGRFGYTTFSVPALTTLGPYDVGENADARTVVPTGAFYYTFDLSTLSADTTVEVALDSTGWQDLDVKLITLAAGQTDTAEVLDVTPDAENSAFVVDAVGGPIDRLVVVVTSVGMSDISIDAVSVSSQ
jgi:hypothetical protein